MLLLTVNDKAREQFMRTIAIGLLGIVLAQGNAAAQTAQEQTQIIRVFQDYVADYSGRHHCLDLSHAAMTAFKPAPRVFTPPVATVFRQLIAKALNQQAHSTAMQAATPSLPLEHHPVVFEPFPTNELYDLPEVLANALPVLPAGIEYRLIGSDLVLREVEGDVIVAVLRDAVGLVVTVRR